MTNKKNNQNLIVDQIYCMDCIEGMKFIPDRSVHLVLADPPYGISRTLNTENKRLGTTAKLSFNFGAWDKFDVAWFKLALRKTKGWMITFCAKKDIGKYWEMLEADGFIAVDALVWQKPDPLPLNAKSRFLNAWEAIVVGKRSGATFSGFCEHNVILKYQAPKGKTRIHPTQKPLGLIKELISLTTQKGDVVLDPFIGSGTTAEAAIALGRHFIGFELDKKYCELAQQRVERSRQETPLGI